MDSKIVDEEDSMKSIDIYKHEVALLIASGWGILPQIPYLLRRDPDDLLRLRRVHLVWQLDHHGKLQTFHRLHETPLTGT